MAEDHGAPEAGQLFKDWTIERKETESGQRASGAESVAAPINSPTSMWWRGSRLRLGWVEMAVDLPEDSSYPGHSTRTFFLLHLDL